MVGLEPTRSKEQGILSPLCLPFHHISIWKVVRQVGIEPTTKEL